MSKEYYIAPTAVIEAPSSIAMGVHIGRQARIASGVTLGKDVRIGQSSSIGSNSTVEAGVIVGPHVRVDSGALIRSGAKICPNKVRSVSSDGRKLESWVCVGPGVLLHDEVELGAGAVVPTQRTIASIGNFGSKNRVVTIYGSDVGPLYSVGCQVGIKFSELQQRVADSTVTTFESANTYAPYMGIFDEIGFQVQSAFQQEAALVEELRAQRDGL